MGKGGGESERFTDPGSSARIFGIAASFWGFLFKYFSSTRRRIHRVKRYHPCFSNVRWTNGCIIIPVKMRIWVKHISGSWNTTVKLLRPPPTDNKRGFLLKCVLLLPWCRAENSPRPCSSRTAFAEVVISSRATNSPFPYTLTQRFTLSPLIFTPEESLISCKQVNALPRKPQR